MAATRILQSVSPFSNRFKDFDLLVADVDESTWVPEYSFPTLATAESVRFESDCCQAEPDIDGGVGTCWEPAGGAIQRPTSSIVSTSLTSKTMHKLPSFSRSKVNGKQWVHPSESLTTGRVVYTVKFLGHVEVDHPKGSDMVREAIRKMKFNKQIKLAEGEKPPKIDLVISIDYIMIQDPKFKIVQFQYPLHHVSYCADDKADKRMFTFIAKDKDSDKHHCFVFDSEKCAEEITLTLGQAFDLAYQRFLDSSSKNVDTKKQLLLLQKKVDDLTYENKTLKERVIVLEKLLDQKSDAVNGGVPPDTNGAFKLRSAPTDSSNGQVFSSVTSPTNLPILAPPPPVPSRSHIPPVSSAQQSNQAVDLFGSTPFSPTTIPNASRTGPSWPVTAAVSPVFSPGAIASPFHDPFGMQVFSPTSTQSDVDRQLQNMDRELMDMQANFSRGLSIGTEDFSIDDLDPLKK